MPSTMIHLLIAHEVHPDAEGLFWVGNFAPDFTNDRKLKDAIHFRNSPDCWEALNQFKNIIDGKNPFEAGWLLHLFVDTCWDEGMIPAFRKKYEAICAEQPWFVKYREEIGFASYYLYHHMDWSPRIWSQIMNAELPLVSNVLPMATQEIEWYRDRVYKKHAESSSESVSVEYNMETLLKFALETVCKLREWL